MQCLFTRMIFQILLLVCLPLRYKMDDQNILTLSVIIISYLLTLQQKLNKNVQQPNISSETGFDFHRRSNYFNSANLLRILT
jgi:hypothetical protein